LPYRICVLIPAYNASKTIRDVVAGALKHLPKVIVADDGSTDNTAAAASEAGAEVIVMERNKGKGSALKALFKKALDDGYDAVISMDADGQHDPEEIPLFLQANSKYPDAVIVGSRMHEKKMIPRARYNSMQIARYYISFAANQFLEDTQCGFRLYPLTLIKKIRLMTERYATETELLIKAGDSGAEVRFVNIRTIYSGNGSHFRPIADISHITAYIIAYLHIKWFIEGVTSNNPKTYSSQCSIRDTLCTTFIFQTLSVATALPATIFFLIEYVFLSRLITGNFASVRKLGKSFATITVATHMLPVVLLIAIAENLLHKSGIQLNLLDKFIERFYPEF